jgi:hypothetical protein
MPKPESLEVERIDISIDRPHRVIPPDVIVKARRKKAGLVPVHPSLERPIRHPQSLHPFSDANRLNDEIARIKAERGLSELESHHNFPRQFSAHFRACGVEPEGYLTYLPRPFHRLRPDGLHTESINWNAQWKRFLTDTPRSEPTDLLKQLHNMWKNVPWLGR